MAKSGCIYDGSPKLNKEEQAELEQLFEQNIEAGLPEKHASRAAIKAMVKDAVDVREIVRDSAAEHGHNIPETVLNSSITATKEELVSKSGNKSPTGFLGSDILLNGLTWTEANPKETPRRSNYYFQATKPSKKGNALLSVFNFFKNITSDEAQSHISKLDDTQKKVVPSLVKYNEAFSAKLLEIVNLLNTDETIAKNHLEGSFKKTNLVLLLKTQNKDSRLFQLLTAAKATQEDINIYVKLVDKHLDDSSFQKEHLEFRNSDMFKRLAKIDSQVSSNNPGNPFGFLIQVDSDGNRILNENLVSAMSMVAYNWLATRSGKTVLNSKKSIRAILGRDSDAFVHDKEVELLAEVGSIKNAIAESLGKDAFKMLGLETKTHINGNFQSRMEMDIGEAIVAVMLEQKLITQHKVSNKDMSAMFEQDISDISNTDKNIDLKQATLFLRAEHQTNPEAEFSIGVSERIQEYSDLLKDKEPGSKAAMETLFGLESHQTGPSTKPPADVSTKQKGSHLNVPEKQQTILNKAQKVVWKIDTVMTNLADKLGSDIIGRISGVLTEEEINALHITERKSAQAVNMDIQRDLTHFEDLKANLTSLNQKLFFAYEVWSNTRTGMKSNTVNPQSSKIHRHLVKADKWKTVIDTTNTRQNMAYKSAIALSMGIKVEKLSNKDITTEFNALLDNKIIIDGVKAIRAINKGTIESGVALKRAQESILAATKEGGDAMYSLEGLVALEAGLNAKYTAKLKKSFVTNIAMEVDGVTNGIIISLLQAIPATLVEKDTLLGKLAAGGWFGGSSLNKDYSDFASDAKNNDSYESLTHTFIKKLAEQDTLLPSQRTFLSHLIGEFVEADGTISSLGRKFSKNPLMVSNYGSALKAIKIMLADTAVQNFYSKLVEAHNESSEAVDNYLRNVNSALGTKILIPKDISPLEFKLDFVAEEVLLRNLVQNTYGNAMGAALEEELDGLGEYRKAITDATRVMFEAFNNKYQIILAEKEAANKGALTRAQKLELLELPELKNLLPAIKGPNSVGLDDRIMIMKQEKQRNYDDPAKAVQFKFSKKIESTNSASAKGTTSETVYLDGGVKGAPTMVQSIDSSVILDVMDNFDVLNVHDAAFFSLQDVIEGSQKFNESFTEKFNDYSILEAVKETLDLIVKETGKPSDDMKASLTQVEALIVARDKNKASVNPFAVSQYAYNDAYWLPEYTEEKVDVVKKQPEQVIEKKEPYPISLKPKRYSKAGLVKAFQKKYPRWNTKYLGKDKGWLVTPSESLLTEYGETELALTNYEETEITNAVDDAVNSILNSSNEDTIDFDKFQEDYTYNITSENSQQLFDTMGKFGHVDETPEHKIHLRGVLDTLINEVISPLESQSVTLEVNENGKATVGAVFNNNIKIQAAAPGSTVANGNQMSAQEVYVHELVHNVSAYGIDNNFTIYQQILKLYKQVKTRIEFNAKKDGTQPWEIFLPKDAAGNIIVSVDLKAEKAAAKARYDYIFNNVGQTITQDAPNEFGEAPKIKHNNYLHEFVALGLTNAVFNNNLSTIKATSKQKEVNSYKDILSNLYATLINWVAGKIYGTKDMTADAALMHLTQKLVGVNHRNYLAFLKHLDLINKLNPVIKTALDKVIFSRLKAYYYSETKREGLARTAKTLIGLTVIPKRNATGEKTAFLKVIDQIRKNIQLTEDHFIVRLAREVIGMTEDNIKWHNLLRYSKHYVDQARKQVGDEVTKYVRANFNRELTKEESIAITKSVLKTDLVALGSIYSHQMLADILTKTNIRNKEIADITTQLTAYGDNGNYYIRQAHSLGHSMVTGIAIEDDPMQNAYNIATLHAVDGGKILGDVQKAEELIDQLASLYAVQYTSGNSNKLIAELITSEPKGFQTVLETHADIQIDAQLQIFNGSKVLMAKGYTHEIYNPNVDIKIGLAEDAEIMQEAGYYKRGDLEKDANDTNNTNLVMYVNKMSAKNTYLKSIVSLTNKIAKGTDLESAYKSSKDTLAAANAVMALTDIKAAKAISVQQQFKTSKFNVLKAGDNKLVPVVNENGDITTYRYMMSEETKDTLLEKSNKFDVILGKMGASITDKVKSAKVNNAMLVLAKEDYDENYSKNPSKYIKIEKNSTNPRANEIYAMMPKDMKADMVAEWGSNEIYVKAELMDIIFGYRKISIADTTWMKAFAKTSLGKAMHSDYALRLVGAIWGETVAKAKDNIVIKSISVLYNNVVSNNWLLLTKGVSLTDMIKNQALALNALGAYQGNIHKKNQLQRTLDTDSSLSVKSKKEITNKIVRLEADLAINPIRELVDEGVFQSIIEDISLDTDDYSFTNRAAEFVGDRLDSGVGKAVSEVYKHLYMSKDTYAYKKLLQATQYSDFVARYTLYRHNIDNKKMTKANALYDVIETFVNYDVPTSPGLQWLNDVGVLMFTKFFFRIQKIIARTLKENPANNMALYGIQQLFGESSDIFDSNIIGSSIVSKMHILPYENVLGHAGTFSGYEAGESILGF